LWLSMRARRAWRESPGSSSAAATSGCRGSALRARAPPSGAAVPRAGAPSAAPSSGRILLLPAPDGRFRGAAATGPRLPRAIGSSWVARSKGRGPGRRPGAPRSMMRSPMDERRRCAWARTPLGIAYHDAEWGVPLHDDRALFELLTLEGAQAGLSWETILQK